MQRREGLLLLACGRWLLCARRRRSWPRGDSWLGRRQASFSRLSLLPAAHWLPSLQLQLWLLLLLLPLLLPTYLLQEIPEKRLLLFVSAPATLKTLGELLLCELLS